MRLLQLCRSRSGFIRTPKSIILPRCRRSLSTVTSPNAIQQTLTEKIVQKYAIGTGGKVVKAGDYVAIRPHHCMTHDNSWPVATKFMSIGATKIHDPSQIVVTLDHDVQNKSETNIKKYQNIENFANDMGVDFYPAGRGIGHQIMVEEGYAWPGTLTVASDSHSNMYGGVSCLGTPIVRTDAASIWATGRTWWQIPPVAKVEFKGLLPKGVTGKDVIVSLCGLFNNDEVLNHAIEFVGSAETMSSIPIDDRLTIANMTTEWGALSGIFPADWTLREWLRNKASEHASRLSRNLTPNETKSGAAKRHPRLTHEKVEALWADSNFPKQADQVAAFAKHLILNLSTLVPYVAGPNSVKLATPIDKLEDQKVKINKAYLVSCTNSRASDIAAAANVFRAKSSNPDAPVPLDVPKVAEGVDFYIAPASTFEQTIAERRGDWQTLIKAGAKQLPAGCGPCIGLGTGLLEEGEVGISASNRNFKGRMGSPKAFAYLSSPEIVAASAISGHISSPGNFALDRLKTPPVPIHFVDGSSSSPTPEATPGPVSPESSTPILPGFPSTISGPLIFTPQNNINTDGIYPGKYTYQDNIDKTTMAKVCMENYDQAFQSIAKDGDILVTGYNFGCGSSREQAATALLAKGIRLILGGSFSNIFARNGINNALLTLEVPKLTERLREVWKEQVEKGKLTIRTGWWLEWDIEKSKVTVYEGNKDGEGIESWSVGVGSLGENVQEIVLAGGLEGWVKTKVTAQT